jgi:hypothetical protein
MNISKKAIVAVLLLMIAGFAFAATETDVKSEAQSYLSQAQQQAKQNDSDLTDRSISSEGNTASARFRHLKNRIDEQAIVVDREKSRVDRIITSGRTVRPEDLNRYERAVNDYSKRVQDLASWVGTAN